VCVEHQKRSTKQKLTQSHGVSTKQKQTQSHVGHRAQHSIQTSSVSPDKDDTAEPHSSSDQHTLIARSQLLLLVYAPLLNSIPTSQRQSTTSSRGVVPMTTSFHNLSRVAQIQCVLPLFSSVRAIALEGGHDMQCAPSHLLPTIAAKSRGCSTAVLPYQTKKPWLASKFYPPCHPYKQNQLRRDPNVLIPINSKIQLPASHHVPKTLAHVPEGRFA